MLAQLIATLNNWLYTYILVILLIAAGLYFTVRTPVCPKFCVNTEMRCK